MDEKISVVVNGENFSVGRGLNLDALLRRLNLAPERLAVELNREVVPRDDWASVEICDGDKIEIVHFVGGGYL